MKRKPYLPIMCDIMQQMKTLLVILVLIFVVGCGGNSIGGSPNTITQGADGSGTAGGPYK